MSQHSKGRLARNIPPITKYPTLYAGRNEHVCVVTTRGTKPEVAEANAQRLIAGWNMIDDLAKVLSHGYGVSPRDPGLVGILMGSEAEKRARAVDAAYMICDPCDDGEGYLLIGDDLPTMLAECVQHIEAAS